VAERFGVRRRDVTRVAGATSRDKVIEFPDRGKRCNAVGMSCMGREIARSSTLSAT
jgi:hypothetical protein